MLLGRAKYTPEGMLQVNFLELLLAAPKKSSCRLTIGGISNAGWHLYVDVPEYDRDSWLILKLGRVEVQESSATILPQVTW